MRINIENVDRQDSDIVTDIIPETLSKQSWSWMEFRLNEAAGIRQVATTAQPSIRTSIWGKTLHIDSDTEMTTISLYGFDGNLLYKALESGVYHEISVTSHVGGILVIQCADGSVVTRKLLF